VFLSHSIRDAELIVGVKTLLEAQALTVYVDWIVDAELDRTLVTSSTAELLRMRMRQSKTLLFTTSDSSSQSKWMPWELGYFDGLRQGRVAILPLVLLEGQSFHGQEYLGLYPLVEKLPLKAGGERVFVTSGLGSRTYLRLESFGAGATSFSTY
jgi:hypothetical protein